MLHWLIGIFADRGVLTAGTVHAATGQGSIIEY